MKFLAALSFALVLGSAACAPSLVDRTANPSSLFKQFAAERKQVDDLVNQINTTLTSGNPALDTARQQVVEGLFGAKVNLQIVQAIADKTGNSNVSTIANDALGNVQLAQGGADNIEKAIETNSTVNQADQLNVAKGLFLANTQAGTLQAAVVHDNAKLSEHIGNATTSLALGIQGGEGVLAAEGVDLATLEQDVLGTTVDAASVAASAAPTARAARRWNSTRRSYRPRRH